MTLKFHPSEHTDWANLGGDGPRDLFETKLLDILGDTRLLFIPKAGDTTTSTDRSRHAATITWDATIASRLTSLGLGYALAFDGSDDEGDISPDADRYSFGDGVVDSAFSVLALINITASANPKEVVCKLDFTSGSIKREWELEINAGEQPLFRCRDESAGSFIGRMDATAFTGTHFVVATYDGSRSVTGINIYMDGVRTDDTDASSGTYTAMENTDSLVRIGDRQGSSAGEQFFEGSMALVAICAKALTIDEVWSIKSLVNSFYDLSL